MFNTRKISEAPSLLDEQITSQFYVLAVTVDENGLPIGNAKIQISQLTNVIEVSSNNIIVPDTTPDNMILKTVGGVLTLQEYISNQNITNWNSAYAWGDHSVAGYLSASIADSTYRRLDQSISISDVTALSSALSGKQDSLVSGTNIKTINGESLLGSGDITLSGSGGAGTLNELSDVISLDEVSGQTIVFNGSEYVNQFYSYSNLSNIPTSFNPSSHTHEISEVNGDENAVPETLVARDIDNAISVEEIKFLGNLTEGRLSWNDNDKTLDLTLVDGSILQIGQEELLRVSNQTGGTLNSGQAVYINGSDGVLPTVGLVSATTTNISSRTVGLVTSTIPNADTGYVAIRGLVRGLNTSTFAVGSNVWLSVVAGQLTTSRPVAPNRSVFIGVVVNQDASNGIIYTHVKSGFELGELDNVNIGTRISGQVIKWSGTVWANEFVSVSEVDGLSDALNNKQDTLVSGTNIKTINGQSLLGSGDLSITAGVATDWADITNTPTTLSGYGITDAQPIDPDLTAIAGLSGTTGILRKTAADTWSLDTTNYAEDADLFKLSVSNQEISGNNDFTGTTNFNQINVDNTTEAFTSPVITSNELTLDLSTSNNFVITHDANINTLTLINAPASRAFGFTLRLDYAGAFTVSWPMSIKWPASTAPSLTSSAGRSDLFVFYTTDGGTSYYGVLVAEDM